MPHEGSHDGFTASPVRHRIESCALRVDPRGEGFVMELTDSAQESLRLEFPAWSLHSLMRALPRIDAACHGRARASGAAMAYRLLRWQLDDAADGASLALHLRNDRGIDAAWRIDPGQAVELHRELGAAIARAATRPARAD